MDTVFQLVGVGVFAVALLSRSRWSWLVLVLLMLAPLLASATVYPTGAQYRVSGYPIRSELSGIEGDCAAYKNDASPSYTWVTDSLIMSPTKCRMRATVDSEAYPANDVPFDILSGGTCPSNSTGPSGGVCICDAGFVDEGGVCVPEVDCEALAAAGESAGGSGYVDLGPSSTSVSGNVGCAGGCETRFAGNWPVTRQLVGGTYHYFGNGSMDYTGGTCAESDSPTPDTEVPPASCGSGQVLANIGGQSKCLADGVPTNPHEGTQPGPSNESETETTTDGSGNTTTTKTSSTTNGDGSVTTKTETTNCDAGGTNCTTSTTEETSGGDPLKSFCEENPKSKICTDLEGSFGGSCASGFLCEGDAIMCAIAREQHIRNCQFYAESTEAELYAQIAAGTDPLAAQCTSGECSNRDQVDMSTTLNTTNRYAGTCPSNQTFVVMGQDVTLPWSNICPYLELMGRVVVAFAMVAAGRTIMGGN